MKRPFVPTDEDEIAPSRPPRQNTRNSDLEVQLSDSVVTTTNDGDYQSETQSAAVSHSLLSTITHLPASQLPRADITNNNIIQAIVPTSTTFIQTIKPNDNDDHRPPTIINQSPTNPISIIFTKPTPAPHIVYEAAQAPTLPQKTQPPQQTHQSQQSQQSQQQQQTKSSNAFSNSAFATFATTNPFSSSSSTSGFGTTSSPPNATFAANPFAPVVTNPPTPTVPSLFGALNTVSHNTQQPTSSSSIITPNNNNKPAPPSFSSFSANPFAGFGSTPNPTTTPNSTGFGSFSAFGSTKPTVGGFSVFQSPPPTQPTHSATTTTTKTKTSPVAATQPAAPLSLEVDDTSETVVDKSSHIDQTVTSKLVKQTEVVLGEEEETKLIHTTLKIFQLQWVDIITENSVDATFSSTGSITVPQKLSTELEKTSKGVDVQDGDALPQPAPPKREHRYVERGVAQVSINSHNTSGKARIVGRHNVKGSILINENISKTATSIIPLDGDRKLRFTTVGIDSQTHQPGVLTYLFVFKNGDEAASFTRVVQEIQDKLPVQHTQEQSESTQ